MKTRKSDLRRSTPFFHGYYHVDAGVQTLKN